MNIRKYILTAALVPIVALNTYCNRSNSTSQSPKPNRPTTTAISTSQPYNFFLNDTPNDSTFNKESGRIAKDAAESFLEASEK